MKPFLSQGFAPLRRFCLILIAVAFVAAAFGAFAQEEENRRLDAVKATLDQIEQELLAGALDDAALIDIQRRVQEARTGATALRPLAARPRRCAKPRSKGRRADPAACAGSRVRRLAVPAPSLRG